MGKCSEQSYQNHSKCFGWYSAMLSNGDCLKVLKCNLCLQSLCFLCRRLISANASALGFPNKTWGNRIELPLNWSSFYLLLWKLDRNVIIFFMVSNDLKITIRISC